MTHTLRPYQERAIAGVRAAWESGHRSVCLVAPTGAGKTTMSVELALGVPGTALWVAHRRELVNQAYGALQAAVGGAALGVIAPGHSFDPRARVQVGTVQSILARSPQLEPSVMVLDECFPAGTPILMADGSELPIESVHPGDVVHAGGTVRVTSSKLTERTVIVLHELGSFECTEEHPIFVKGRGYVEAKDIRSGDLLCVWSGVLDTERNVREEDLQRAVQSASVFDPHGAHQSSSCIEADDRTQSNAVRGEPGENVGDSACDWAWSEGERRERQATTEAGDCPRSSAQCSHRGRGDWSGCSDGRAGRCAESLQVGRESSCVEDGDRGRRTLSLLTRETRPGRTEKLVAQWSRVEGVALQEPRNRRGPGDVRLDRIVYNLETDRGCYVAARTLVHNCHHYLAEEWLQLAERWPAARVLGPTATPQRGDGKPLGDLFTSLIVAAQYSELIAAGYLCDAVVYQPPPEHSGGLANDPVAMWAKLSRGMRGFAFMPTIKEARELAVRFTAAGFPARCIDAKTKKSERDETLRMFAAGELTVITNVDTMTEGVDVPAAGVCLLGRSFRTVGAFLQAAGRVLRPHQDKEHAIIIDLTGATILHLPPTIDRIYSLEGQGIRKEEAENPVRNCAFCGLVYLCAEDLCPGCGSQPPPRVRKPARIYSFELQEVWAGERTADDAKAREYLRLRETARARGFGLQWVIKQYRELFGSAPALVDVTHEEKREELRKLQAFGKARGFKPGFAAVRYRDMFGAYPARTG